MAYLTKGLRIRFVDEEGSKGLKRGGVLNSVRHELELICDASEIPEEIAISLAGLDIGDSIHISHVTLPHGAESAITDRDYGVLQGVILFVCLGYMLSNLLVDIMYAYLDPRIRYG